MKIDVGERNCECCGYVIPDGHTVESNAEFDCMCLPCFRANATPRAEEE